MSARTAARKTKASSPPSPLANYSSETVRDWYTPKVLKVSPLQVSVTLGEKAKGRVRCVIGEVEWERNCVDLKLIFEEGRLSGARYSLGLHSNIDNEFGGGTAGTFTKEQIDWLIDALIVARREADRQGLFTPRPTPISAAEVLGGRARSRRRSQHEADGPRAYRSSCDPN